MVKALSIRPDWMEEFISGRKTVECRTWKTDYRGPVCLCTTNKKIRGTIPGYALLVGDLVNIQPFQRKHLKSAAMTQMPDIKSYAWIFEKIGFIEPVPVKGKLSLWETDFEPQDIPDNIPDSEIPNMLNAITFGLGQQ